MSMRAPAAGSGREDGMILVNVLLFVAIASAVLLLMITAEQGALHRSARLIEAARARAAAQGGELSAIVALRRDAAVAPETDNGAEPWARIADKGVAIRGGRFDLAIADAEDRFNINLLMKDDPAALAIGGRIAEAVGLTPRQLADAVQYIRVAGPLTDLGPLRMAGLRSEQLARLDQLVTALPVDSRINLNSVGEDMLGIMSGDPIAARTLIAVRTRQGFLTPQDLLLVRLSQPPLASFVSNTYWVRTRVTIGDTSQQLTSLLIRRREGRDPIVVPIARWWGPSPPRQAPGLDRVGGTYAAARR